MGESGGIFIINDILKNLDMFNAQFQIVYNYTVIFTVLKCWFIKREKENIKLLGREVGKDLCGVEGKKIMIKTNCVILPKLIKSFFKKYL